MKKLLWLLLLLGLAAAGVYLAREGLVPGLPSDIGVLKEKSARFMECLKFKDFQEAARFHSPEDLKANPNIPKLLEKFFLIPPENLDVQHNQIDFAEIDSTGLRGRVKTTSSVNVLNQGQKESRRVEAVLYWKKIGPNWYLDLRTTLERTGVGF